MTDYTFKKIYNQIDQAEHVLIVAHQKPDGDALGSSSTLVRWIQSMGKQVTPFCKDLPPQHFHFIDNLDLYTNDPEVFEDPTVDLLIVLDSGDFEYAGIDSHVKKLSNGVTVINIDHHATNQGFGHLNYVNPAASSVCEIMYWILMENDIEINREMATSLMTGIITDTSAFSNPATSTESMDVASELVARGARSQDIINHLFKNKSMPALRLWGRALERLHEHPRLNITCSCLTVKDVEEIGASNEDVEGIVNFLNMYLNVDTVLLLREIEGDMVKGSLRSVKRDVSKIAKIFGGGGHKKAAGFAVNGKLSFDGQNWAVV